LRLRSERLESDVLSPRLSSKPIPRPARLGSGSRRPSSSESARLESNVLTLCERAYLRLPPAAAGAGSLGASMRDGLLEMRGAVVRTSIERRPARGLSGASSAAASRSHGALEMMRVLGPVARAARQSRALR